MKECTEDCPNPTDFDDQDTENNKARRSWGSTAFKEGKLFKRDDGLVNSHKVLSEMVFVSLPRDKVVEDYEDFVYDKSAGSDVMLYIVDSGAGLSNNDVSPYLSGGLSCVFDDDFRSSQVTFDQMFNGFAPQVNLLPTMMRMIPWARVTALVFLPKLLAGNTALRRGVIQSWYESISTATQLNGSMVSFKPIMTGYPITISAMYTFPEGHLQTKS